VLCIRSTIAKRKLRGEIPTAAHDNEPSGSIKSEKCLDHLGDYQLYF
jgi:hypothetical protein